MRTTLFKSVAAAALVVGMIGSAACKKDPKVQGANYLEQGKKHLDARDYASALIDFKNAQRLLKNDAEPLYQLGLTYLAMGNGQDGARALVLANKLDPKHIGAQLKLAELMTANRDPEYVKQGEERAKNVLEMSPDNPEALQAVAVAELRLDHAGNATELLEKTLEKFPGNLQSSVTLALVRLREGKTEAAEDLLKKAVAQAPQSAEAAFAMGQFYLVTKKTADAEQWLHKAIDLDPKQPAPMENLGQLLIQTGRADAADSLYRQLSTLPQKELRPIHAMFLFNTGKRDAAVAELEGLVKQDSKDRYTRSQLVTAYSAMGRFTDAEKLLTGALKQNPKDSDALIQRGQIFLSIKMASEAEKDFVNLVQAEPTSGNAHYALSKAYAAEGAVGKQRAELTQALTRDRNLIPARMELSRALAASRDLNGALSVVDETPAEQKNSMPIIVQRISILMAMDRWNEAREEINRGLKVGNNLGLVFESGLWKMHAQDFPGARAAFEENLKGDPEGLDALRALVASYELQKKPEAGLQRVRQQVAQFPKSAPLHSLLAQVLLGKGDMTGARAELTAAVAADPSDVTSQLLLAELDSQQGNNDAGRQRLTSLLDKNPQSKDGMLTLADVEMRAKNYPAAIDLYRKVIAVDESNIMALNNLAYLLANNGNQPDEALKLAQQVKQLEPNSSTIEDTIGWAYYQKGQYKIAVGHLETATAATPRPVIQYHLAMAYFRSGDRDRGTQVLGKAMKADSTLPETKMALEVQRASLQ